MKRNVMLMISMLVMTLAVKANAGVLLEPYVGYHTGKFDDGTTKTDDKATVFGARVGFQQMGLMVGADVMTGKGTIESGGTSYDNTPSDLGAFIGYEFPMLLRVYGEYIFNAKAKISGPGFEDTFKGKGMKVGVGFKVIPLLAVNLEMVQRTFNEDDSGTINPEDKENLFGLVLSIPLSF